VIAVLVAGFVALVVVVVAAEVASPRRRRRAAPDATARQLAVTRLQLSRVIALAREFLPAEELARVLTIAPQDLAARPPRRVDAGPDAREVPPTFGVPR
jgi:hypothetical protein